MSYRSKCFQLQPGPVKAGRLSTRSADEIGLHPEAEQYDGEKANQQGNQYTFSETFLSHVSNHIRH
jgi:hypothetical protein